MNQSKRPTAPFFGAKPIAPAPPPPSSAIPSSSPFATPVHPLKPFAPSVVAVAAPNGLLSGPKPHAILPILLPPATLRPLAFRTFTKKHGLTLTSTALQELATFVGRHCGSGWREEGLAEKVLEEVAKSWKGRNGGVIVDGASAELVDILRTLEGSMSGGKIVVGSGAKGLLSRQNSLMLEPERDAEMMNTRLGLRPTVLSREDSQSSLGVSGLGLGPEMEEDLDDEGLNDVRKWLKVVDAYEQPRLLYNVGKKHFEKDASKPSLLPPAAHKTTVFRNRYNVIHQRLLRNESFQSSAVTAARGGSSLKRSLSGGQNHKLTPIANLLGRHGSHHMILGMLVVLPTGGLAISDLTATIALDLSQAVAIPEDSAWFSPGMIVLVDGVYEEEEESIGKGLSGSSGVGGTLGGRFQGFFIGQPPCEKRRATLGVSGPEGGQDHTIGGGFGWIDFLGVGSQRAVGPKMRRLEQRLLRQPRLHIEPDDVLAASNETPPSRGRLVVLGECNLDNPKTLQALRKILAIYAAEPEGATPMTFVLAGNFTQHAVMARGAGGSSGGGSGTNSGSIEYKEYFDTLASALSDYPTLLRSATFVFLPGDNDGWVSAFTAGAATPLPRKAVPSLFTSRVRRAFATANAEGGPGADGEAIWSTNPCRLSVFGPSHEIVLFRDDLAARLRRTAVRLKDSARPTEEEEQDLVEQGKASQDVAMSGALPAEGSQSTTQAEDGVNAMDLDSQHEPQPATKVTKVDPSSVLSHDDRTTRKLVRTLLDQGYLAPFRQAIRPVHWDYATALHLYPLPTALVLVDPTAPPFCLTYEGCHVVNPGSLLEPGRKGVGRWVEYELGKVGIVRECNF